MCGIVIKLKNEKQYSEVHHIKPLGKCNRPDFAEDIIILCPKYIKIQKTLTLAKIFIHLSHELNKYYLSFHPYSI